VRAPQVGQAVGAPSLISWVASAESWADPRRGRRAGMSLDVIGSPLGVAWARVVAGFRWWTSSPPRMLPGPLTSQA